MHRLRKKLGHLAFAMHRRLEVLDLKRLCERTLIGVRCSEAAGWVNAFDPQCKVSSQAKVENDIKVDEYLIYLWNILKMNSYIYHIYMYILQESACRKWAQPRSAWAAEPSLEAMSVDNVARVFALADKYSCNRHWMSVISHRIHVCYIW